MKFSLVFENTGDSIPFETKYNQELIEFFIDKCGNEDCNSFSNHNTLASTVSRLLTDLHWSISKTNEVLYALTGESFEQLIDLSDYLDQVYLNRLHATWVKNQNCRIDIDQLRTSNNKEQAQLGCRLHDMYPDEIRVIKTAPAMEKLGYLYPYENVNMAIHHLESIFSRTYLEFAADNKWEVFENPFRKTANYSNDQTNFSFGYTYVGRQYYDKFVNYDDEFVNADHYNFETLEYAFQLSLHRPETKTYSPEFVQWAKERNIELISYEIPIGNIPDLVENLTKYRKILYKNSLAGNRARLYKGH